MKPNLNIQAHAAQLKAEPAAYLGHVPNSGVQAHSTSLHYAHGIIMEMRMDKNFKVIHVATKNDRVLAQSPNYDRALAAALARVQH